MKLWEILADGRLKQNSFELRKYQEAITNVFILDKVPNWYSLASGL